MSPGFVFYVKFEYNRNVGEGGDKQENNTTFEKKMDGLQMFFCVCVFREKEKKKMTSSMFVV